MRTNLVLGLGNHIGDLFTILIVLRKISPCVLPCCSLYSIRLTIQRHIWRAYSYAIRCYGSPVSIRHSCTYFQLHSCSCGNCLSTRPILFCLDIDSFRCVRNILRFLTINCHCVSRCCDPFLLSRIICRSCNSCRNDHIVNCITKDITHWSCRFLQI